MSKYYLYVVAGPVLISLCTQHTLSQPTEKLFSLNVSSLTFQLMFFFKIGEEQGSREASINYERLFTRPAGVGAGLQGGKYGRLQNGREKQWSGEASVRGFRLVGRSRAPERLAGRHCRPRGRSLPSMFASLEPCSCHWSAGSPYSLTLSLLLLVPPI